MLKNNLIKPHEYGGIKVNNEFSVIDKNNNINQNIKVVGELTKGDYFIIPDLYLLKFQIEDVVNYLFSLKSKL
jgi:hypothetical protein